MCFLWSHGQGSKLARKWNPSYPVNKLLSICTQVITSEASYLRSINMLNKIFVNSEAFCNEEILTSRDKKALFSNVLAVQEVSNRYVWENNGRLIIWSTKCMGPSYWQNVVVRGKPLLPKQYYWSWTPFIIPLLEVLTQNLSPSFQTLGGILEQLLTN